MKTDSYANKLVIKGLKIGLAFALAMMTYGSAIPCPAAEISFKDSRGQQILLKAPPRRVVSLVPAITEMIYAIGAQDKLVGVTIHDKTPFGVQAKALVGGFFNPSLERIQALRPDLIFVSSLHNSVRKAFKSKGVALVEIRSHSLKEICTHIKLMGSLFAKPQKALGVVNKIQRQVDTVARKVAKIPRQRRKRVMRLMGAQPVSTPGDDSFQNDFIRAAGGVPPHLGKKGQIVTMTLKEWQAFNPQIIYVCGGRVAKTREILSKPGWKQAEAVAKGRIISFPCDLACRASVNAGGFIAWLASRIYADEFSSPQNQVDEPGVLEKTPINLDLDYLQWAGLVKSRFMDNECQTLLLRFKQGQDILSTLEGFRSGITGVGNNHLPPPLWGPLHRLGLGPTMAGLQKVLGLNPQTTSLLVTGADMSNLAMKTARFQGLAAYALVTAGVRANAMRAGADEGKYLKPGTINIILLSNRKLSPRAMARLLITATEAKTAALNDLDIRSSNKPRLYGATGTGTDNIIVVQGQGLDTDLSGGHTKIGELAAKAVYQGVREAVARQNRMRAGRHIFARLAERRIRPGSLARQCYPQDRPSAKRLGLELEALLMDRRHSAFVASAFALEDAWWVGRISNMDAWRQYCLQQAKTVAGGSLRGRGLAGLEKSGAGPLDWALAALAAGAAAKLHLPPPRFQVFKGPDDCGCPHKRQP
ncbi:MAG: helical backbone metal receptor [Desulfarculaceae bacterium]|jgi:ABC-type Fe3+-hydroxamate transport system substrate-binding protein/adenosylcobinamide amidohydrolase